MIQFSLDNSDVNGYYLHYIGSDEIIFSKSQNSDGSVSFGTVSRFTGRPNHFSGIISRSKMLHRYYSSSNVSNREFTPGKYGLNMVVLVVTFPVMKKDN